MSRIFRMLLGVVVLFSLTGGLAFSSVGPNTIFTGGTAEASESPAVAVALVLVPYQAADWRFMQVNHGELEGFQEGPEPPGFSTGQAAFGSDGSCPLQSTVQTDWSIDTDMLLRRTIDLPAGTRNVDVSIRIDNDFVAFWNGVEIDKKEHEGCAGEFVVPVADSLLNAGENLLAIRAIDRGGESFLDAKITGQSTGATVATTIHGPDHTPLPCFPTPTDCKKQLAPAGLIVHDETTVTSSDATKTPTGIINFRFYPKTQNCNGKSILAETITLVDEGGGVTTAESTPTPKPLASGNYSYRVKYIPDNAAKALGFIAAQSKCEQLQVVREGNG